MKRRRWIPGAASVALVGFAAWACGEAAAPAPAVSGNNADPTSHPAPAPAATTGQESPAEPQFEFQPGTSDATDVALGETRVIPIRLHGTGEGTLPAARLVSSCECLSAEFASALTRDGAAVNVIIEGSRIEDIDGVITLEDEDRRRLAEHVTTIFISRRTFVFPREVVLAEGQESFTVGVYRAFAPEDDGFLELGDFQADPAFEMVDYQTPEELTFEYVKKGHELIFQVAADAGDLAGKTVQIESTAPEPVKFEVTVRRRQPGER